VFNNLSIPQFIHVCPRSSVPNRSNFHSSMRVHDHPCVARAFMVGLPLIGFTKRV